MEEEEESRSLDQHLTSIQLFHAALSSSFSSLSLSIAIVLIIQLFFILLLL